MKKLSVTQTKQTQPTQIVMVCVTRQRTCARLIECGESVALERGLPLHVVHAVRTGENFLGNAIEGEALEYLLTAAQLSGGELTVLRADDAERAIADYAIKNDAAVLVLGTSPEDRNESFIGRLERRLPNVHIVVV